VLVEHLVHLEPLALAPLAQPLQLGVGEARKDDLVGEAGNDSLRSARIISATR
jgi:hypothetical protein